MRVRTVTRGSFLGARLDLALDGPEFAIEVGDQRQQGLEPATG